MQLLVVLLSHFRFIKCLKSTFLGTLTNYLPLLAKSCFKISSLILQFTSSEFSDDRAGIFKKSMGARHRGGIGFSYRPARLHRLAEFIPWHQFRGPIHI
jgi:hypothetical protein